jgi:hypothetical protein
VHLSYKEAAQFVSDHYQPQGSFTSQHLSQLLRKLQTNFQRSSFHRVHTKQTVEAVTGLHVRISLGWRVDVKLSGLAGLRIAAIRPVLLDRRLCGGWCSHNKCGWRDSNSPLKLGRLSC